ncbi:hypothetical protein ACFVP3_36245 [Streptomyces sp. NPDC057806]|uniref:hypothetical protein n=1 Tax=Streptomyces sp. NPDC057806 TaxID=3346255 RepID=UPI0036972C06
MGTAQRREAPEDGGAATRLTVREGPDAPDLDIPAARREIPAGPEVKAVPPPRATGSREREEREEHDEALAEALYRPLWVEEPARRRRLPDPVRTAAVRAVLIIAVTLMQAVVAFLCTLAGSWLAFPMVLSSVASTVVATWAALDVWVTRQVWNQRHGVVSTPASTARQLRRERRKARRQARSTERGQGPIHGRRGAGQLSHS